MTNLQKAIKIVRSRLPESYLIPIRTYKTIYSLMRGYCRADKKDYKKMIKWYIKYFNSPTTNTYMKTKYSGKRINQQRGRVWQITALAFDPILIAEDNIKGRSVTQLVFLLIHELGHHWLDRNGYDGLNERWCDEFSIRWCQRMIRENILQPV